MSVMLVGEKYRVFIERPDGTLMEMDAIGMSLSTSATFDGIFETDLNLRILGNPIWSLSDGIRAKQKSYHAGNEWECLYCHRPNAHAREVCESCGAVRSFIYE